MMTHSTAPLSGTPKARAIEGRLMLTMELSRVVIKAPGEASAKTAHLLAVSSSRAGVGVIWGGIFTTCGPSEAHVISPVVCLFGVDGDAPDSVCPTPGCFMDAARSRPMRTTRPLPSHVLLWCKVHARTDRQGLGRVNLTSSRFPKLQGMGVHPSRGGFPATPGRAF